MHDDNFRIHIPIVSERQWEVLGNYLLEGWYWLFGRPDFIPLPKETDLEELFGISLPSSEKEKSKLERLVKENPKVQEALATILTELEKF